MREIDAEYALRSLGIEALAICNDAGFEMVTITAIPSDGDCDDDYYKVVYHVDNRNVSVTTSYDREVTNDDTAAAQEAGDRAWRP